MELPKNVQSPPKTAADQPQGGSDKTRDNNADTAGNDGKGNIASPTPKEVVAAPNAESPK